MISYSYSTVYPKIQRLQGGILYPHGIELVKTADGETQYRFRYLKFIDTGQDISDHDAFTKTHADKIKTYLEEDEDLQRDTEKNQKWEDRLKEKKDPNKTKTAYQKIKDVELVQEK